YGFDLCLSASICGSHFIVSRKLSLRADQNDVPRLRTASKGKKLSVRTLRGPKPLKALTVGIQEFSADKSPPFDLSVVNLSLVPEVCRKAEDRAQIEDGKCELISVD